MRIFKSAELSCSLVSDGVLRKDKKVFIIEGETAGSLELIFSGRGRMIWPNREGEIFNLKDVYPSLKQNNCLDCGISISHPATASSRSVGFIAEDGLLRIFRADSPSDGRHCELRIFADSAECVKLSFSGEVCRWRLDETAIATDISAAQASPAYQFQLGMISPYGETEAAKGFSILPEIAERIKNSFAPFTEPPIIHLFGYGAGHDIGYPDYTPSPELGGEAGLRSAAAQIHDMGFKLSCYLNARIAEEEVLGRYPGLLPGICHDKTGAPLIELYQERRFNVMKPSFTPWLDHLYGQAMMLQDCGADAVQLDQVAGRAPVVPPGEPWGDGYRRLIERLQKAGLMLWIQGVSDYYPADWFEMSWRDLSILPGGILRGGNPFGETDLSLLKALMPSGRFLAPLAKLPLVRAAGLTLIIDMMTVGEQLPLYGEDYLSLLSRLEQEGI